MEIQRGLASARLAALAVSLAKDANTTLEQFWQEISKSGAPLIEPIDGNPTFMLATFLYRGEERTKNVVVLWTGDLEPNFKKHCMQRLGETDLWYLSYRVRKNTRATYQLGANDPQTPMEQAADHEARFAHFEADRLNPKGIFFPADEEYGMPEYTGSILEMPDAPPQPWITPCTEAPRGKIILQRFQSKIMENERRIWVYTPSGYDPGKKNLPWILLFDGSSYLMKIDAPTILDNLIHEKRIPSMIAVLVDSISHQQRGPELHYNPAFVRFLAEELIPWLREKYALSNDPHRSAIGGMSAGGGAAFFTALNKPEIFGNVLSQSGGVWRAVGDSGPQWLVMQYASRPVIDLRFYMDVGNLETTPTLGNGPSRLTTNRNMARTLAEKGYSVQYTEFSGNHDVICWRGTFADGLLALMQAHNMPRTD
jgi:enterochelin esterase-like enzyme